jgi:hypothetical protein
MLDVANDLILDAHVSMEGDQAPTSGWLRLSAAYAFLQPL